MLKIDLRHMKTALNGVLMMGCNLTISRILRLARFLCTALPIERLEAIIPNENWEEGNKKSTKLLEKSFVPSFITLVKSDRFLMLNLCTENFSTLSASS